MDAQTLIENLKEAGRFYPYADHVFLVDGDAFALSADRLERIAGLIHAYLPQCKTITMYAAARNIKTKTDEQLIQLKKLGINDLYVGIESGLNDAGIRYCMMLMPGLAGKGRGIESGIAAAKLANVLLCKNTDIAMLYFVITNYVQTSSLPRMI